MEIEKTNGFEGVVNSLPNLIKQCVDLMDTPVEKKMALYASTVMTGALMPHVNFVYDRATNYPNLYSLILYPPASGKGKLTVLRRLLSKVEDEQMALCSTLRQKFKVEEKLFERKISKGEQAEPPKKPQLKQLVIPGNTTSSKLTEQLDENGDDSMALIYETEADAFTRMMNSTNGADNSMILRKSFQNEPISQMRRTNSEYLLAKNPKLAVVLTGTNSQLPGLFHSNEDGCYSRFLILKGSAPVEWKDVSPCKGCKSINDQIGDLSKLYWNFYNFFKEKAIEIQFTEGQWQSINDFGKIRLKSSVGALGEYASSIPKRHALMIAKIASVFTVTRYFENQVDCADLVCSDVDFENAYWMVEQSYEASIDLFESMSMKEKLLIGKLDEFYEKLPDEFQKKELAPLKVEMKVSDRTIERFLEKLIKAERLVSPKKGFYKKPVADLASVA